jgi:hypothetical protein
MIPAGPGTDALDRALAPLFGSAPPSIAYPFSTGEPPFTAVKILPDLQRRFWFFITYGCSDLDRKRRGGVASSGLGYELTLRAPFSPDPPVWAAPFLDTVARILRPRGTEVPETEPVLLGRPLTTMEPTLLDAAYFAKDVQLGHGIDTPHGYVAFLQVVGLHAAEAAFLASTPGTRLPLEERLSPGNPFLTTVLGRASVV